MSSSLIARVRVKCSGSAEVQSDRREKREKKKQQKRKKKRLWIDGKVRAMTVKCTQHLLSVLFDASASRSIHGQLLRRQQRQADLLFVLFVCCRGRGGRRRVVAEWGWMCRVVFAVVCRCARRFAAIAIHRLG